MKPENIIEELQKAQKQKVWYTKTRIMNQNRLIATIAGRIGYSSNMKESDREKLFTEAKQIVKEIENGTDTKHNELKMMVIKTCIFIDDLSDTIKYIKKEMEALVKKLPIASWIEGEDRRGFDYGTLATIIGEAGDLSNYENPGKLWRRFGCAPYEHGDKVLMGSTWRSGREGKLPASCWEEFGYSPRRRSIVYLIGENTVKTNKGSYRKRYDEAKASAAENHPEWTRCSKCTGTGLVKGKKCGNCKGTGKVMLRCHRHAMLLASKKFLKDLWIEWNKDSDLVKNYRNKYITV